jgi:hypothetical protein
VLEATPTQGKIIPAFLSHNLCSTDLLVQQNKILESKIQRRPSRTMTKKPEKQATLGVPADSTSAVFGSSLGSVPLSTSLGPSSSHGPQIFLRIRVADTADTVHISTTIPVYVSFHACLSLRKSILTRLVSSVRQECICRKFLNLYAANGK